MDSRINVNGFGNSPLSGLSMTAEVKNENGFNKYYEANTTWASSVKFDAGPNDQCSRPRVLAKPRQVGDLDLTKVEMDKLCAYAFGLVVKRHLEAIRGLPGASDKFCLFVTKEEYDDIEYGRKTPPYNYQPILLEDLWRDANRLTLSEKADLTILNLSLLEDVQSSELRIAVSVNRPNELPSPAFIKSEKDGVESPVGLVFGAKYGERPTVLAMLLEQGLIVLGDNFRYKSIVGQDVADQGAQTIRITPKGYWRVEELLKGFGAREAFLICRFAEPLESVYQRVYQVVGKDSEVNCPIIRVKDEHHNDQIDDRIIHKLNRASIILVDLSGAEDEEACKNFNVAFEAGYALALGKQIVWTINKAQWSKGNRLPFDIQNQNVLQYEMDKLDEFRNSLKYRMLAALEKSRGPT